MFAISISCKNNTIEGILNKETANKIWRILEEANYFAITFEDQWDFSVAFFEKEEEAEKFFRSCTTCF